MDLWRTFQIQTKGIEKALSWLHGWPCLVEGGRDRDHISESRESSATNEQALKFPQKGSKSSSQSYISPAIHLSMHASSWHSLTDPGHYARPGGTERERKDWTLLFFFSFFLLACITCTKGFHCDISIYAYNYFDHIHPSITLYFTPFNPLFHNFQWI
jgi:hypothetical protein